MDTVKDNEHSRICPQCHLFVEGTNQEIYDHTESCDGMPGIITTRWYTVEELHARETAPRRHRPATR